MTTLNYIGVVLLVAAVAAGTWLDGFRPAAPVEGLVLVADFHVHPFPGDGALTVVQLQREARRRGLDVVAVTGHNNLAGWRLGRVLNAGNDVIVLPGQEITAPGFHLIAVGVSEVVDWRLSLGEAVAAIHGQGGAAIAAHPLDRSWLPRASEALAQLDGVEVAHPEREAGEDQAGQLDRFFAAARAANPRLSPIGSSDFHMAAPLGRCRTYVFVETRSAAGVIDALRTGTTLAECRDGRLFGSPELAARLPPDVRARHTRGSPSTVEQAAGATALLGLALLCVRRHPAVKSAEISNASFRNTP